jgi:Domain of unknown function (DUF4157)
MAKQRQLRRKRRGPKGNTSRPAFFQNANPESSTETNNTTFFGPASGKVQPKLQVNQPGDVYEKQADAMAEQVVNSGPPAQSIATPAPKVAQRQGKEDIQKASQPEEVQKMAQPEEEKPVQKMSKPEEPQRKEQEEVQRKPEEEQAVQKKEEEVKRKPEEEKVQTKTSANGGGTAPSGFASNLNHSKGQGSGLSKSTLNEMSSAFGQDFSGVRIHTDSQAEQLSEQISAQAFTHGNDIYFNQGKYNPESQDGKRLLAHELTHVVQQGYSEEQVQRVCFEASAPNRPIGACAEGARDIGRRPQAQANTLDSRAQAIITAAQDQRVANEDRAIQLVNAIICTYMPSQVSKVRKIYYHAGLNGLETQRVGSGTAAQGDICVGTDFLSGVAFFARRVLQVRHEIEHINQYRSGMIGSGNRFEREFLAFYQNAMADEFEGTGRMNISTRFNIVDGALRNYYCLIPTKQTQYANQRQELLQKRSDLLATRRVSNPGSVPSSCPTP